LKERSHVRFIFDTKNGRKKRSKKKKKRNKINKADEMIALCFVLF